MGLLVVLLLFSQSPPACATPAECRQQALAAADAGDYETFHDLAWRAVQKGRPNDPDLMFVLARAQALSGRPGDALVMLQRLVDMGAAPDITLEDFGRVRALKGWPELEAKIAGRPAPAKAPTPSAEKAPSRGEEPAAAPPAAAPAKDVKDTTEEALSFEVPPFDAVGLAYDAVSRRFIVGDRKAARLMVIDEVSHHVTNLVSAASAGFYDRITAFEIDVRRGDLWVLSTAADSRGSVLHKLQLVSGRVLEEIALKSEDEPATLVDVTVAADGTVYAAEQETGRIVRLRPRSRAFEDACRLKLPGVQSLTLADERLAYVSSDAGITQVDLSSCAATPLHTGRNIDINKVERLRWQNGGLVVVQRLADGQTRIARARLDGPGKTITRLQTLVLARQSDPRTSTIAGTDLYYLVSADAAPSIRKVKLR